MVLQVGVEAWQSALVRQVVLHEVAFAQRSPPGQGIAVPGVHVPEPLQVALGVSVEPEQLAAAQTVAVLAKAHVPPAPQVPVKPQAVVGEHCPAGAGVPANWAAQVPLGCPVWAKLQA